MENLEYDLEGLVSEPSRTSDDNRSPRQILVDVTEGIRENLARGETWEAQMEGIGDVTNHPAWSAICALVGLPNGSSTEEVFRKAVG